MIEPKMEAQLDGQRFTAVWTALGARHTDVFSELEKRYEEPHRHYHTVEHILECLSWFDHARELAAHPAELEAALWFHDAVYDPLSCDNEGQSAELARRAALTSGVSKDRAERIAA